MSHELFYTSAPKGLQSGSRGFCTVACTAGMPPPLMEKVESLSGYRPLFPPLDAKAGLNPVAWSHLRVVVGSKSYGVLSRTCAAGLDYSERTNKFAHHVVLESHELPPGGPAWLLRQPGFLETKWDGQVRTLPAGRVPPRGDAGPAVCHAWQKLTGDAGWAGVLAEALESNQQALLLFEPGMDLLPLLAEALQLLPAERRWGATFSTYATSLPQGIQCACRGLPRDSAEAAAAARLPGTVVIDLAARKKAAGGPLVETARTGKAVAAAAVPRIPANAVVEVPLPETPAATSNRFVPIGRPAPPPVPGVPAPLRTEPPPPPVPVLPSAVAPPVAVRGFSGKSFGLGAGVGILATAAAVAALVIGAPEQVAARLPSAEAKVTPVAEQPDEIKAAAVKEYAAKHEAEIRAAAVDDLRRTHETEIKAGALRAYMQDSKNRDAVQKDAVAAYRKEHPEVVQSLAAREYHREHRATFLQDDKNLKAVLEIASADYAVKHKPEVRAAAVKDYLADDKNKKTLRDEAIAELRKDPALEEQVRKELLKAKEAVWKDAYWKDYAPKLEQEVRKKLDLEYQEKLKKLGQPTKKPDFQMPTVGMRASLPPFGNNRSKDIAELPAPGRELRTIGAAASVFAPNGSEFQIVDKFANGTLSLMLKETPERNHQPFAFAELRIKGTKVEFNWNQPKKDLEPYCRRAAELLKNRILEVAMADGKQLVALREPEIIKNGNSPFVRSFVDGLNKVALDARQSAFAASTEKGAKLEWYPVVLGPVDVELEVVPGGSTRAKFNRPLSMYMKVGDHYVEVLRAEDSPPN